MWSELYSTLRRRYALPALSGVLLILTFYPLDFWLLGFVAIVPLFYHITQQGGHHRSAFESGAVTGALFSFFLACCTVLQFHWLDQTYLFVALIRASSVIIVVAGALVFGMVALGYSLLRGRHLLVSAFATAALCAAGEMLLQGVFGGYYIGSVAYASAAIPWLMSLAALGGMPLVTFAFSLSSVLVAECIAQAPEARARFLWKGAVVVACVGVVCMVNWSYLHRPTPERGVLPVAIIQTGSRTEVTFGTYESGTFSFPALEQALIVAATGSVQLVVYPFSPVEGALYRGPKEKLNRSVLASPESAVGEWLKKILPADVTLLTWNTLYTDGAFKNVFEYWEEGEVVAQYQKRALFPFMDYTPQWAQRIGLFSTPYDEEVGVDGEVVVGGVTMGNLLCSEINHPELASLDSIRSSVLISVGSETMFTSSVASEFNARAAQFRAVENNIPIVRANLLGPSVLVARDGVVLTRAEHMSQEVLTGELRLSEPLPTLYRTYGNIPVLLFFGVLVGAAALTKRKDIRMTGQDNVPA